MTGTRTSHERAHRGGCRRWLPILLVLLLAPAGGAGQEGNEVLELSTTSEAARTHFWAGVEDAQNVFGSRAVSHLEQALEADPDFGLARVVHAFLAPMDNDERMAAMAGGIAAMGEATSDELLLATALKTWRSGNAADASRMLALLSRMNPDDPHLLHWATQIANARGDRTDPAERWRRAIERFPDYPPPHNLLAYALSAQGDRAGALEAVREYARLAPDHPNAHDSYAELLQADGRYEEALMHYDRAMQIDSTYLVGLTGQAEVYVLMGEYEQAAERMTRAAHLSPTAAARVNNLRGAASALMLDGDRAATMRTLASALEAADNDDTRAFVHLQMAVTAAMMGRRGDVQGHLDQAEALGGGTPANLVMASVAHAAAGQGNAAREAAARISDANPFWQSIGHAALGLARLREGDANAAMSEISRADPSDLFVQAVMAMCLDELGRDAEANAKRADVLNARLFGLANPFIGFARRLAAGS